MSKKVKMVLHAEPGVGKSTFAAKAPRPFFLCTDGNYEWLDLPDKDHIQVYSWAEAIKVINDMVAHPEKWEQYDTIVIDLIEDLYKWCEFEYCQKNKLEHIGDKGYGMGYDIVANQFFVEICKLIGVDKHIIFLTHGYTKVEKDRRGVEIYKFYPSNRIRDKVWDMIEGRVRYFLRAYIKDEEDNDRVVKRRYLSLIPKGNEFGIARGLDESKVPEDINLDWNEFASIIGLDSTPTTIPSEPKKVVNKTPKQEVKKEEPVEVVIETKPLKETVTIVEEPAIETEVVIENSPTVKAEEPVKVEEVKEVEAFVQPVEKTEFAEAANNAAPIIETKKESQEEKLAKLKAKVAAKLAAMNKN